MRGPHTSPGSTRRSDGPTRRGLGAQPATDSIALVIDPQPAPSRVSRRVALLGLAAGGSVGVAGLTGCTTPSGPAGAPATSARTPAGPAPTDAGSSSPEETDDTALLARVRGELVALAGTVASAQLGAPVLRRALAPLVGLHRTHAEALGEPLGRPRATRSPRADPQELLDRVRSDEVRWQRRLVDYSVQARSGSLARLLASMSAGTAQQLAVLAPAAGGADA